MIRNNAIKQGLCSLALAGLAASAAPLSAQEMVQTFKNPSFGGNPFYSDHLLAIAGFNRPTQPTESTSPEDLLASQLRAQLTSSLSANILTAIQTAKPGDTGAFTVGAQQISFSRTATETTVTFTNTRTGEVSTLVIPVLRSGTTTPFGSMPSAESVLASTGRAALPAGAAPGAAPGLDAMLGPAPL